MAKRPTARAKAASKSSSSAALSNLKSDYLSSSSATKKKSKRLIRHDQLLAKVRQGGINKSASARNANGKVRRPGNKLKTAENLSKDLGDALPDVPDVDEDMMGGGGGETSGVYAEDEWEGISDDDDSVAVTAVKKRRIRRKVGEGNKMVMKSLSHRQGSMKRKKVLEEREMERFRRNLAQLATAESGGEVKGKENEESQSQKWAALRAFIGTTLEKDKAFGG